VGVLKKSEVGPDGRAEGKDSGVLQPNSYIVNEPCLGGDRLCCGNSSGAKGNRSAKCAAPAA